MNTAKRLMQQRGVSLIEALIAMAVMSFGMLALVGVQSTLRFNADVARQRAEATRIAEQELERTRTFMTVGSGSADATEFDALATKDPVTVAMANSNATFTVVRSVVADASGLQKAVNVNVSWDDRSGTSRSVILRDIISRADPTLSGILSSVRKLTPVGRRENRHPTIPPRAHDLGDGTSIFKPNEGQTVAWVFDNLTGQIIQTCVVSAESTSTNLTAAGCTVLPVAAQLLSGAIRFNLRGVPQAVAGFGSVFKPIPGGTVAWVIDADQSRIVKRCAVPAGISTASLTVGDLTACAVVNPAQDVLPFATSDASYTLQAIDSEDPHWPALDVVVKLDLTSTGHAGAPTCIANAPTSAIEANAPPQPYVAEYFCIILPNSTLSWSGKTTIVPKGFGDANPDAGVDTPWTIGTTANDYRVCRYTKASTDYTANEDHPKDYAKWSANCGKVEQEACRPVLGNLINQNFLVIAGTKSCPTDVASNPATGDMVNSNTLQHQP